MHTDYIPSYSEFAGPSTADSQVYRSDSEGKYTLVPVGGALIICSYSFFNLEGESWSLL